MKNKPSISITHPHLLKEWDWETNENEGLDPSKLTYGSDKKAWWICKKGHRYKTSINSRTNCKSECPYCSNKKVNEDNCFSSRFPELLKYWDFDKNLIKPNEIMPFSKKKIWCKCENNHSWKVTIANLTNGNRCPFCCNQKVDINNCLATTHPELANQWNPKNKKLTPYNTTYGSEKKVWWKCQKGHEWKDTILNMKNGKKCPYCSNKKACHDNCLEITHPELAKQWSNKNTLKPTEVTYISDKKIIWKCSECHNEWKSRVVDRTRYKTKCPYCTNRKVYKDNCLATTHPHIVKQWSNKNTLKPTEVTAKSNKRVLWICLKCNHEWYAYIYNITSGYNCPICNESKGEKEINKILKKLNIRYKREYRFKNLNKQPFDFAIFKKYARTPYAVIEYQGKQHYKPVCFGGTSNDKAKHNLKLCQKRDKIKKQFCQESNIKLLEIPYTEKKIKDFIIKNL